MHYEEFVKNMIESYLRQPGKKAIFIKYYSSLRETVMGIQEKVCDEDYECTYLYHNFCVGNIKGAYEPFLEWVKELYEMHYKRLYGIEQFIGLCGVYDLHKEVFCEYIRTGTCKRTEDVLVEEFDFECEQMLKSMYSIFNFVSNSVELVFVISNIHIASESTFKLIKYMIDKDDDIRFIFSYNDSFMVRDYVKTEWDKLLEYAKVNKMIPEGSILYTESNMDYQDEFVYDESEIDNYFEIICNMYYMLALSDADYYLENIYEKIFALGSDVDDNTKLKFVSVYAMVNLGLERYNKTLFICENMVPLYSKNKAVLFEYYYNYISALAHLMMIESELVSKFCKRCRELIEVLPSESEGFREKCKINIEVLECLSCFGNLREVYKYNYSYQADENVVESIKKIKYENFLAYMYIFGYDNDAESVRKIAMNEKEPTFFNKGIEIATRIGNTNLLMRAYVKNIFLFSEYGYHKYVRYMYEKRIAIIPKENKIRRAHSYSGLGYNSIVLEEYADADKYFRNSISMLIEENQAENIAETLYNMSLNYYIAGAYSNAIECMENALKIMEIIGVEGIRICNTSKLYGIMSLAYYKLGRYYDTYYCINMMSRFLAHIIDNKNGDYKLWEEDLFLFYLNKAILCQYEGKMDEANVFFEKSYKYMIMLQGIKFYSYREYAILRAEYYEENGNQLMRYNILKEAYKYYDENRYPYAKNKIEALMDNAEFEEDLGFAESAIDFDEIIKVAINVGYQNSLQKKEKDINFISLCQEILVKENNSTDQVVENTMNIIQNTFNIDKLFLIERGSDRYILSYAYGDKKLDEEDMKDIFNFFDNHRIEFLVNRIDKEYNAYRPVTEKMGVNNVATIIGIPIIKQGSISKIFIGVVDTHRNFTGNRILLKKNNLTIIKCVINQLDEAIKRIKNGKMLLVMNERLKEVAITDQLTGIYNRQGYKTIVGEQIDNSGIVMYMDVDNFKYYNDTFGHSAGDKVLKQFADTIQSCIGEGGKAIRYGGDEFIAILPNVTEDEAKVIAKNIIDDFQEILSNTIIIDGECVGCSIGISSYFGGVTDNVDMALKYADKALYNVKNSSKGKYAVWSEITE